MDRDKPLGTHRTSLSALVHGEAETKSNDPVAALQQSYEQGINRRIRQPIVITLLALAPPRHPSA